MSPPTATEGAERTAPVSAQSAPERARTPIEPSLPSLEMEAWVSFSRSRIDLVAALERDLSHTGLSLGDYEVFKLLSSIESSSMRMCDLARLLRLSPSGLTRRLDSLVKDGFVERRSAEHDRRVMLAAITPAGRRKFAEAQPAHIESVRRRITGLLDETELQVMATIFDKVRSALDIDADAD